MHASASMPVPYACMRACMRRTHSRLARARRCGRSVGLSVGRSVGRLVSVSRGINEIEINQCFQSVNDATRNGCCTHGTCATRRCAVPRSSRYSDARALVSANSSVLCGLCVCVSVCAFATDKTCVLALVGAHLHAHFGTSGPAD